MGDDVGSAADNFTQLISWRIHEEVQDLAGNMAALGRLMTVLEHIRRCCATWTFSVCQPRCSGQCCLRDRWSTCSVRATSTS